jgi:NADP-dependent 3-hydroxy acid dehydrogenase YdfG
MRGLAGKWVLITGAAGGIGAATTARFIEEGATVIALDRDPEGMDRLENANPKLAGRATLDVTNEDQLEAVFSGLDRLDVLINNAGISQRHSFLEISCSE